jgi:hypothetical protein
MFSGDREGITWKQWQSIVEGDKVVFNPYWTESLNYVDVRKVYEIRLDPSDAFSIVVRDLHKKDLFAIEGYFKKLKHNKIYMFTINHPSQEIFSALNSVCILKGATACWRYVAVFHNKTGEFLDFVDAPGHRQEWLTL